MSIIGEFWKEKINNLIQHHKEAKYEVEMLLNELNSLDSSKMSEDDRRTLETSKIKAVEEYSWRGVFINQLNDLL